MDLSYPPPLDQLLTLGEVENEWRDYGALGISHEHIPGLIAMVRDERLLWEHCGKDDDNTPFWGREHAWRALGQLRAEAAIGPVVDAVFREPDSEGVSEDIPTVLAMIGPPALDAVIEALTRADDDPVPDPIATLADALREMCALHPEVRDAAVAAITAQLRNADRQPSWVNSTLISNLVELRAVESAPVIEEAFARNSVDEFFSGDWEDVQVDLGLLQHRRTPRRHFAPLWNPRPRDAARAAVPHVPAPPPNPAAKARSLRKAQKAAKRKRR